MLAAGLGMNASDDDSGNESDQTQPPSDNPSGEPDDEEDLELKGLEYAFVASNEFTEKDEKWLFSPENPERPKWVESWSLEKLKVEAFKTFKNIKPGERPPPGCRPIPIVLLYCKKRSGRFKCRAVCLGNL